MVDDFSFDKIYLSSVLMSKLVTQKVYVSFSVIVNNQERIMVFGHCQYYEVKASTDEKLVFIIRGKRYGTIERILVQKQIHLRLDPHLPHSILSYS